MDDRARAKLRLVLADRIENLAALEGLYADTGNPLFVWDAIATTNNIRELKARGVDAPDIPLVPAWAAAYLAQTAINVCMLASGESLQPSASPLDGLSQALDFVPRKGTSRFVAYRAARRELDIADRAVWLKAQRKSANETNRLLAAEFGDMEASVLRRKITKGKRLRKRIDEIIAKSTAE